MHDAKAEDGRREAVVPMRRISRSVRVARGLTFRETMAGYFARGAHAPTEGARLGLACAGALARFGQLFGGELWDSYIVGDR